MKKDKGILGLGVFLSAMLLVDLYLIKNAEPMIVLAAAGAVTLEAAYLVFDKIYSLILKQKEEKDALAAFIKAHCEETEKADKAKYLLLKRTQELVEEKLSQIETAEAQLQEAFSQLIQEQNKNAKLIVKYNREDNKKLAALSKADMEKLIATVNQNGEKQLAAMKKNVEQLLEKDTSVQSLDMEPILDAINQNFSVLNEKMAHINAEPAAAEEPVLEEAAVSEEETPEAEEAPVPEIDLSDPNRPMGQDDIAALLASMGVGGDSPSEEETAVEEVPVEAEEPVLEEAAVSEEEMPKTEEAPVPEMDLSDPNKQLSPDEIAALFSSLG